MKKIICVANQKGGVGKTTTTVNLAACLAAIEKKTLLIDLDPQGNATSGVGIDKNECDPTIYQVLMGDADILQAIKSTELQRLFCVPSNGHLTGAEVELVGDGGEGVEAEKIPGIGGRGIRFRANRLPPSLGFPDPERLDRRAVGFDPFQAEYYALEGLSSLMETIERVRESLNPELTIEGAVLTMHDARTRLANQVGDEVKKFFGEKIYQTVIPRNVQLSESPSFGKPIILYDIRSSGAQAYLNLTKEVVARD